MRIPMVAGNWKMNNTAGEAVELVKSLVPALTGINGVDRVICPPFISLMAVSRLIDGTPIQLGAQNLYWAEKGAYTGEVSPGMVKEFCEYVILGHSERREYFLESNELLNKKLNAALENKLKPIFCIGETLEQYEAGKTSDVVTKQLNEGLAGIQIQSADQLVVAYEPIWAIGTGKASTGEDANYVIGKVIRPILAKLFGNELSDGIRILYGGSVKPANAVEFFSQSDIDGALVGGASLKASDFAAITEAAVK